MAIYPLLNFTDYSEEQMTYYQRVVTEIDSIMSKEMDSQTKKNVIINNWAHKSFFVVYLIMEYY